MSRAFSVRPQSASYIGTVRAARRRILPPRYETDFRRFNEKAAAALAPSRQILDVGAGARPSIEPADRPPGCHYVGLDASIEELRKAQPGSYDELVVGRAEQQLPQLLSRFDLLVSVFSLEHVRSLPTALGNCRAYLRPGGLMVAQLAGAFSPFAVLNRVLPPRFSRRLVMRLNERPAETIFKAYYDHCWAGALRSMLAEWQEADVIPLHVGAGYVLFSELLTALFIAYEEIAYRTRLENLATYYLIVARA